MEFASFTSSAFDVDPAMLGNQKGENSTNTEVMRRKTLVVVSTQPHYTRSFKKTSDQNFFENVSFSHLILRFRLDKQ